MKNLIYLILLGFGLVFLFSCSDDPCEDISCTTEINQLKLNEIQILGSHNSYRLMTDEDIFALALDPPFPLPADFDPLSWEYYHFPIDRQMSEFGIRALEIDIYRDPDGGTFYNRMGNALVGKDVASGEPELLEPGLKVLHLPDFDYNTNYLTFKQSLNTIKTWSNANPNHLPITVVVQALADSPAEILGDPIFTDPLPFDEVGVEEIDQELEEVFSDNPDKIFTPDKFIKEFISINEAVRNGGWPILEEVRGKLIFVLLGEDETIQSYIQDNPKLTGRKMFVFSDPGNPESSFINIDRARVEKDNIEDLVSQGYIVRTRADADTREARDNFDSRRIAAVNSGAQLIYTDYYSAELNIWSDYSGKFPNGALSLINQNGSESDPDDCLISCPIEE